MLFHYKAFVIVMAVTTVSFIVAKKPFLRFMTTGDFTRRRNVWLGLTAAAFLMPNFWLFVLIAIPLLGYAAIKDSNPVALYLLLLLALPPMARVVSIPGFINELFTLDYLRLLTLAILLPECARLLRVNQSALTPDYSSVRLSKWTLPDFFLVSYMGLQCLLTFPYQSLTACARLVFDLIIFTAAPYFSISRGVTSRERLVEAMAAFALGMAIMVPLGVVEFLSGWVLYQGFVDQWEGGGLILGYLTRGEFLRAQVAAGHSLIFGFSLAVAFGMWLYLQIRVESRVYRALGFLTFVIGLIICMARGSWVGSAVMLTAYSVVGPNALQRLTKSFVAVFLIGGVIALTPYSANIVSFLPFYGAEGDGSVDYRQQLAEMSWNLIKLNPFFGSFNYLKYMESLRQGQGIIDMVNSYAAVALPYGLIGASLYFGFYVISAWRCYSAIRRISKFDMDLSLIGASLLACLVGTLVIIGTVSQFLSIPAVQVALAGLAGAYVAIVRNTLSISENQINNEIYVFYPKENY